MTSAPSASAIAIDRARRLRFCSSLSTIPFGFSSMSPKPSHRVAYHAALDQQHREEDEQIEDGESEEIVRRALGALAVTLAAHPPGERDHQHAGEERCHPVNCVGIAEKPRGRTDWYEPDGIEQNLSPRFLRPGNHREHRNASAGVVVGANERQRPEMWRRPEEEEGKEETGLDREAPRPRPPADDGRKGARGAADNNVLRRRSLEPCRIDSNVKEDREGEQRRREPAHEQAEHSYREGGEH